MNIVYNDDFLNNNLPDKSQQLIIADPPYFEVKGEFDFIWKYFDDYLKDVEKWAIECKRLLADNGSLFWWGHAKKIAYSQIILDKYFHLGNSLVWEKIECKTKAQDFEQARHFSPITERCLFYTNEIEMTGLEFIEKEYIAPRNPFAKELKKARLKKGVSINQVAEYGKFYGNVNHGGAVTNWERGYNVPLKEQWKILSDNLPIERKEYEDLRKEYEDLRKEYEDLRRTFNNVSKLTDVIKWSQESNVSRHYNHETIKPLGLTRELIRITTRENDNVFIPFGGSGTEMEACKLENRNYTVYEIKKNHYETIKNREKTIKNEFYIPDDENLLFRNLK